MLIRNCVGGITPFYFVIFLLLTSVMSSVHCLAQWSANPALNNDICTAVDNQSNPTITSDGNGGAIITWLDFRGGTFYDIYAQRIDAGGVIRWTIDGVAICTAAGDQSFQTITADGAGGAIITWRDARSGTDEIYVQRINAAGVTQWASNGVQISSSNTTRNPSIISDGSGGAIITWQDFRSGIGDIYAQRIDAGGTAQWTSNGVAICASANNQRSPSITSDGIGGAIITWEDVRNGINNHIYTQRVNASGATQWTTNGIAICTSAFESFSPTITTDGSAGAIITWYTNLFVTPTDGNDIYAQRINASGVVQWIANGVAICKATADQSQPVIVSDGSAGAIISWGDQRSGTYDVYAQRINTNGTLQWTTDGEAICTATNSQSFPAITSDGSAGAIISWYDFRSGTFNDIYAQRIDASGAVQWTSDGVAVSTAGGDQTFGNGSTSIISNSNAESIITWRDTRNGSGYDIYAQHVNADGSITIGSQTITTSTPASGPIGTTVTITGTNFSTTPADNIVRFNGTLSVVTASSATSITTTVPTGASTGPITVEVGGNTATSAWDFRVIIITTHPSDFSTCAGGTATFTADATGSSYIKYEWYFASVVEGPYTHIPAPDQATNTLLVNTTENSGAGFYRCAVYEDWASVAFTNPAQLTVIIATPPTTTGAVSCGASSLTVNASGGTNGQYRWYTTAVGGVSIAGEVNSAYATPVISESTAYYVAIDNGTCESVRKEVVADIITCAANLPPSIMPMSTTAQIDGKVILNLETLISDPDNNLDLSTLKIIIHPESKAIAFIDSETNLTIDYKGNSFTGKDHLTIEVCDLAGSCAQQEITVEVEGDIIVYNAISPNGDNKNDTWIIKNIELLQDTRLNHVIVFNRWGDAVFETDDYDNLNRQFNGRNKSGSELPAGTYFYKIAFASGRKSLTGYISLKR